MPTFAGCYTVEQRDSAALPGSMEQSLQMLERERFPEIPLVHAFQPIAALRPEWSAFPFIARGAGYSYRDMIQTIVDHAFYRYRADMSANGR